MFENGYLMLKIGMSKVDPDDPGSYSLPYLDAKQVKAVRSYVKNGLHKPVFVWATGLSDDQGQSGYSLLTTYSYLPGEIVVDGSNISVNVLGIMSGDAAMVPLCTTSKN